MKRVFFMKKIVFAEVEEWEQEPIQKNLPKNFNARLLHESINELTRKELEKTRILSIFIYSKIDRAMLEKMPLLEAIATRSTGTDHIDLEECRKRGIKVYNVPTYGENTVAEHTFGLILALSRKIYQAINRAKKGDF